MTMSDVVSKILGEGGYPLSGRSVRDLDYESASDAYVKAERMGEWDGSQRWVEVERDLMKDPNHAYYYVCNIRHKPWPEAEPVIVKCSPGFLVNYAVNVLRKRWPEAEQTIASSAFDKAYLQYFPKAAAEWEALGWRKSLDAYE